MPDEPQVIDEHAKEIIAPGYTFGTVTDQIATVVLTRKTPVFWFACFSVGLVLLFVFLLAVGVLFAKGTPGSARELWRIAIDGGAARKIDLDEAWVRRFVQQGTTSTSIHPDGHHVAFATGDLDACDTSGAL